MASEQLSAERELVNRKNGAKKTHRISVGGGKLPDLDSNQDKQNQNLSYYPYTIRQSLNATLGLCSGCKNTIAKELFQILLKGRTLKGGYLKIRGKNLILETQMIFP